MTRKPHLTQVDPPAPFTVCEPCKAHWNIAMMDNQSDDILHYTCPISHWAPRDVAIAAAREAANGQCVVAVQRVLSSGIPDLFQRFAVRYAWSQWQVIAL